MERGGRYNHPSFPKRGDDKSYHHNSNDRNREYFRNSGEASHHHQQQHHDSDNNNSIHQSRDGGGAGRRMRKPEQQFYVASKHGGDGGAGDGFNNSGKMNNGGGGGGSKLANRLNFGDRKDDNYNNNNSGNDRYSDQYGFDGRQLRQASEPRQAPINFRENYNSQQEENRSRDTRSVESNVNSGRNGGRKPPSGRRSSNSSEQPDIRLPSNIESLPPRLQRKFLKDNGLPISYLENLNQQPQSSPPQSMGTQNWSQTLPAKGRGREWVRRDFNNFHRNQNQGHHNQRFEYTRSRSRSSDVSHDDYDFRSSNRSLNEPGGNQDFSPRGMYNRRPRQRNNSEYSNESYSMKGNGGNYNRGNGNHKEYRPRILQRDHQSASNDKLDQDQETVVNETWNNDNGNKDGPRQYERRRRRRGGKKLKKRKHPLNDQENMQHQNQTSGNDEFRAPYPFHNQQRNRNRKNSQSSAPNSRDNSNDRTYRTRHFHNRSRKNSYENCSRESSADRHYSQQNDYKRRNNRDSRNRNRYPSNDRQWSSRDNSADSGRYLSGRQTPIKDTTQSWRKQANLDKEFENISKKILTLNMQSDVNDVGGGGLNASNQIPGLIQLPGFETKNGDNFNNNNNRRNRRIPPGPTRPSPEQEIAFDRESHPVWYKKGTEAYNQIHSKHLIDNLVDCDYRIQELISKEVLLKEWDTFETLRQCLQKILQQFLMNDIKFCGQYNVENHFWKLLYYNVIELLRRGYSDESLEPDFRQYFKEKALEVVEEGLQFFEQMIEVLERHFKFSVDDFIGMNAPFITKGLKFLGLALVSSQKIFLCLGDLARYRELINDTGNYGVARQWYTKAQQVMPNNGRPYYQLGVLSVYSKRKVDAVYYYMRNLMSSNPIKSAKENLMALFDEIRKKYESNQKKREEKNRLRLKDKEHRFGGPLRRETWIHPRGGRRIHRTTPLDPAANRNNGDTSEEEELEAMTPIDLNKRFITSYLHVHGKLITRIGMESFTQCAVQMLREFRALLRIAPIPITQLRLLQLTALNMFAIESTQLKDPSIAPGARSAVQECAISIALMMFGLILEKFVHIVKEAVTESVNTVKTGKSTEDNDVKTDIGLLNEDALVLLPSIKIWCDWLMNKSHVWNPPPSCSDYKFGSSGTQYDPWTKLAQLIMVLETMNTYRDLLSVEKKSDDYVVIRLEEDIKLAGFTPLFGSAPEDVYCHRDVDNGMAQTALRLQKILFVASKFLCSCDPPVLKKVSCDSIGEGGGGGGSSVISTSNNGPKSCGGAAGDDNKDTSNGGTRNHEYVCVVQNRSDESSDSEFMLESFSDDDLDQASVSNGKSGNGIEKDGDSANVASAEVNGESNDDDHRSGTSEIKKLLRRKDELERSHKMQEKRQQRYQDILRQSTVHVHIEIHPKYLIPDTNCFVDFLDELTTVANSYPLFQLLVPLVVVNELDGLSKGNKVAADSSNSSTNNGNPQQQLAYQKRVDPVHAAKVAEASKNALTFLKSKKNPGVKWVTTKGSFLTSSVFTNEDDSVEQMSNDDKILTTALQLSKNSREHDRDGTRFIVREVVLLTTDRNLRVKSLARDIPVRELPDFIRWAGLGS